MKAAVAMQILFYFVVVVHVIVSLFLIGVVLLQQGRSADLAGAFGGQGSQTAFGPRAAANVLTRLTTWSAVVFMCTSLTLTILYVRGANHSHSVLDDTKPPRLRQNRASKLLPILARQNTDAGFRPAFFFFGAPRGYADGAPSRFIEAIPPPLEWNHDPRDLSRRPAAMQLHSARGRSRRRSHRHRSRRRDFPDPRVSPRTASNSSRFSSLTPISITWAVHSSSNASPARQFSSTKMIFLCSR